MTAQQSQPRDSRTARVPINPGTCFPWLSIPHHADRGFPGTRTQLGGADGHTPVCPPHVPSDPWPTGWIWAHHPGHQSPGSALSLTFGQGGFLQDLIQEIDQLVRPPARDVHSFDRLHVQAVSCPELCQLIRRPHQLLPRGQVRQVGRPARRVQPAVKFKPCSEAGGRAGNRSLSPTPGATAQNPPLLSPSATKPAQGR